MTKVILTVLALIYLGAVYFARFAISLLVIVFCGFGIYELFKTFHSPTSASRRAA